MFFHADRRAARKTAQVLHDAELHRIRRSRLALESRLQAMQARVEPQFLFNTLAQVERLYEVDPALGARMLDDLIAGGCTAAILWGAQVVTPGVFG